MGHTIIGLILLVIVFGGVWYLYQAHAFDTFLSLNIIGSLEGGTQAPALSPDYHTLRVTFVSLGGATNPSQVTLTVFLPSGNNGINVTGWKVVTDKGTFTLPKVLNTFSSPSRNAPPEDMYVRDGDHITLVANGSGGGERASYHEWQLHLGDLLQAPHGSIVLEDQNGSIVDEYKY